jgi:uncharacterized protein (DUF4415 family)
MSESERIVTAIRLPDGRVLIEEPDGTVHVETGKTDLAAVDATTEDDIARQIAEDPDDPGNDPAYPDDRGKYPIVYPPPKERITVRLDADVLAWLKAQGPGYQTRLNAILRGYMEHAKKRGEGA